MEKIPAHPKYSHEEILKITKQFETMRHLRAQYKDLSDFIQKNKLKQIYCTHMRKSNEKLSLDFLKEKCKNYSSTIELMKKDRRL